jgi:hypothetical protein
MRMPLIVGMEIVLDHVRLDQAHGTYASSRNAAVRQTWGNAISFVKWFLRSHKDTINPICRLDFLVVVAKQHCYGPTQWYALSSGESGQQF